MKKYLFSIVVAGIPAFAFAFPGPNTIQFKGEVTDQTCAVTVNGNAANPMVLLPSIAVDKLLQTGATAGETKFTVGLSGCSASPSARAIKTVFVGNQVTSEGNLRNTGTAKHVALQLFDPATPAVPFNLSSPTGYAATGLNLAEGETSATHDFDVRYIAEDCAASVGSVLGSVQYSVNYE